MMAAHASTRLSTVNHALTNFSTSIYAARTKSTLRFSTVRSNVMAIIYVMISAMSMLVLRIKIARARKTVKVSVCSFTHAQTFIQTAAHARPTHADKLYKSNKMII